MCVRILATLVLFVAVVNSTNCPPVGTNPVRCFCKDRVDSPGKIGMNCAIYNLTDIERLSRTSYSRHISKLSVQLHGISTFPSLRFQFQNLMKLDIVGENLTSVHEDAFYPLRDTLVELRFVNTSLQRVPVEAISRLNKLKYLFIQYALIGSFNDSLQTTPLESLQVPSNGISTIANDVFPDSLKSLDITKNKIVSLNGAFRKHLPYLHSISISENKITSLNGVFEGTPSLKTIHAEHNRIVTIDDHCLATVPNLRQLYLSFNRILEIHDGLNVLPRLQIIDLGHNRIDTVSEMAFQNSPALRILKLNNNRIRQLPEGLFDCLTSLHVLDLGDNFLSNVNYLSLPSTAVESNLQLNTPICDFWKDSWLKSLNLVGNVLVCSQRTRQILQALRSKDVVVEGTACLN